MKASEDRASQKAYKMAQRSEDLPLTETKLNVCAVFSNNGYAIQKWEGGDSFCWFEYNGCCLCSCCCFDAAI